MYSVLYMFTVVDAYDGVIGRYNGSLFISVQFTGCWTNVSDGSI